MGVDPASAIRKPAARVFEAVMDWAGVRFEGIVRSVDEAGGTIEFWSHQRVAVDPETTWDADPGADRLVSLVEVRSALERDEAVKVGGEGAVKRDGSIVAARLEVEVVGEYWGPIAGP